ncbi:MAG TPA: threonine synthase, partial [Xylella taiwanensis]
MNFLSTRTAAPAVTLSQAIVAGLAPDGGLYVPECLPPPGDLNQGADPIKTATTLLAPFFAGDALDVHLPAICAEALGVPAPL